MRRRKRQAPEPANIYTTTTLESPDYMPTFAITVLLSSVLPISSFSLAHYHYRLSLFRITIVVLLSFALPLPSFSVSPFSSPSSPPPFPPSSPFSPLATNRSGGDGFLRRMDRFVGRHARRRAGRLSCTPRRNLSSPPTRKPEGCRGERKAPARAQRRGPPPHPRAASAKKKAASPAPPSKVQGRSKSPCPR